MQSVSPTHALVLLIKAIADQLNEIASLEKSGQDSTISRGLLREMCSVLPDLEPDLQEEYFRILPNLLGKWKPIIHTNLNIEIVQHLTAPRREFVSKMRAALVRETQQFPQ